MENTNKKRRSAKTPKLRKIVTQSRTNQNKRKTDNHDYANNTSQPKATCNVPSEAHAMLAKMQARRKIARKTRKMCYQAPEGSLSAHMRTQNT
jgi:hypothetical protein